MPFAYRVQLAAAVVVSFAVALAVGAAIGYVCDNWIKRG